MRFRTCCALLFLLLACAPELQAQVAIPWAPLVAPKPWVAPLVAPKPVVVPAPIDLTPPVPITVAPRPPQQHAPEAYSAFLQGQAIATQVSELQRERVLAKSCGFDFWVGVRSAAHKVALLKEIPDLKIAVMDWC